jgi:hypothetical protein
MKKLVAILAAIGTAFCILFSAAAANAAIEGPCIGVDVEFPNDQYYPGTCGVTRPAHASATFSSDGSTITLKKVNSGQVAAFWQSLYLIEGTPTSVCVTVSVDITGRASGEQRLVMSTYEGDTFQTFLLSSGLHEYCANFGTPTPMIAWQLITYVGDKPFGRAVVTETLINVTIT